MPKCSLCISIEMFISAEPLTARLFFNRPPQKRRPNAAYRDHQIYRHIILSVAKYMKNPEGVRPFIDHMDHLYPLRHSQAEMALNIGHTGNESNGAED